VKTDRRICGANRLPAAPARTRGVSSGGCGSCGSADFVSGAAAGWDSQFRDRPDKDRRAVDSAVDAPYAGFMNLQVPTEEER